MKTRVAIIALVFCGSLSAQPKSDVSRRVFVRNAGIVGAGFLSAFDVLNRILMTSEIERRAATCPDQTCANTMREQKILNAVGLGFETLPGLAVLFTWLVYIAKSNHCFFLPHADDKTVLRVTTLAATMALVGSSVGTGTASKSLSNAVETMPSTPNPLADYGRFIASTVLSGVSLASSLFAVGAALLLVAS